MTTRPDRPSPSRIRVTHRRSGLTHSPWLIAISLLMIVLILTGAWLFVGRWPDPTEPALPAAVCISGIAAKSKNHPTTHGVNNAHPQIRASRLT